MSNSGLRSKTARYTVAAFLFVLSFGLFGARDCDCDCHGNGNDTPQERVASP
jgi:hypothetical protein